VPELYQRDRQRLVTGILSWSKGLVIGCLVIGCLVIGCLISDVVFQPQPERTLSIYQAWPLTPALDSGIIKADERGGTGYWLKSDGGTPLIQFKLF
jgi:hypothetical protein